MQTAGVVETIYFLKFFEQAKGILVQLIFIKVNYICLAGIIASVAL